MKNNLGNKETFAKNLTAYMERRGVDRQTLCDALDVPYTTVRDWVKGNTYPRIDKIEMMAKFFHVSKADLIEEHTLEEVRSARRISVYSSVHAGIPDEMIDDVVDFEDIPADWPGEYFGVKVKGDCMFPKYIEGDTIIVRVQPDCESGQDVIARVNGYEAILRTLDKAGDTIVLRPLNPAYPADIYTGSEDPITICGVVVELRRKI